MQVRSYLGAVRAQTRTFTALNERDILAAGDSLFIERSCTFTLDSLDADLHALELSVIASSTTRRATSTG